MASRSRYQDEWTATRETIRKQNAEAWRVNEANAVARAEADRKAKIAELSNARSADAIASLRAIMDNADEPIARRAEAAEVLLVFELAPGSLATPTAAENAATDGAYAFLQKVANTDGVPASVLLRVLKTLANIQAVRASRVDPEQAEAERYGLVELVNFYRSLALHERGLWPRAAEQWEVRPEDELDFLMVDQPSLPRTHARYSEDRRHFALAARIRNRPDPWDDLDL